MSYIEEQKKKKFLFVKVKHNLLNYWLYYDEKIIQNIFKLVNNHWLLFDYILDMICMCIKRERDRGSERERVKERERDWEREMKGGGRLGPGGR